MISYFKERLIYSSNMFNNDKVFNRRYSFVNPYWDLQVHKKTKADIYSDYVLCFVLFINFVRLIRFCMNCVVDGN